MSTSGDTTPEWLCKPWGGIFGDTTAEFELERDPWLRKVLAAKDALADGQVLWVHGPRDMNVTIALHLHNHHKWARWRWGLEECEDGDELLASWAEYVPLYKHRVGVTVQWDFNCNNRRAMYSVRAALRSMRRGYWHTRAGAAGSDDTKIYVEPCPVVVLTTVPPPDAMVNDPAHWVVVAT